jgi:DNA helicase-2/ATP-dependent DNA helicase PcrA
MTERIAQLSPAEDAAREALDSMFACIRNGRSFRLEAGAGAGKTYSLVKALRCVIDEQAAKLKRASQHIACITYTNVASDQITSQIDRHPVVHSSTIHSFCWTLISCFQPFLREKLPGLRNWKERLDEIGGIGNRRVDYDLGHPRAKPEEPCVYLGHDDVLDLVVSLMEERKFRDLFASRFPVLFIDEYQDTNSAFAASLLCHFIKTGTGPLIGLFGDSWQKIYGDGCGLIDHENLIVIGKKANFRSVPVIVDVLNKMRPDLPQYVKDTEAAGTVNVYHTNDWTGTRRKGGHWSGDLPPEDAHAVLQKVRNLLSNEGWDFAPENTKILMLTHSVLAAEQHYGGIAAAFQYNGAFAKKESPHIAFLIDVVEPVCAAYRNGHYGEMLAVLGSRSFAIKSQADKKERISALDNLLKLCENGSIGQVLDYLNDIGCPPLPEAVERTETELLHASPKEIADSRMLQEIRKLRDVSYREVVQLSRYLNAHTPFSTKHGVKGAQFENVLVVFGRGWNDYNWKQFLEWSGTSELGDANAATYERNRNLFYVACSRPKRRLALLFTQELSTSALSTLSQWFGKSTIRPVGHGFTDCRAGGKQCQ